MVYRVILVLFISIVSMPSLHAQKASKKKTKQERKAEQFLKLKQTVRDSSFFYQTTEIIAPYIASNWSGGYLSVQGTMLRVQQLDWVDSQGEKTRLQEVTELKSYRVTENEVTNKTTVTFECSLKGKPYLFTITFDAGRKSELVIQKTHGELVKYTGRFKTRFKKS